MRIVLFGWRLEYVCTANAGAVDSKERAKDPATPRDESNPGISSPGKLDTGIYESSTWE